MSAVEAKLAFAKLQSIYEQLEGVEFDDVQDINDVIDGLDEDGDEDLLNDLAYYLDTVLPDEA